MSQNAKPSFGDVISHLVTEMLPYVNTRHSLGDMLHVSTIHGKTKRTFQEDGYVTKGKSHPLWTRGWLRHEREVSSFPGIICRAT